MHKIYLTPDDQLVLDPTGKARDAIRNCKASKPTPVPSIFSSYDYQSYRDEWRALAARSIPTKYSYLHEYDESLWTKYAPQGAKVDFQDLLAILARSYRNATHNVVRKRTVLTGKKYFIRLVKSIIGRVGVPTPLDGYRGTVGTAASLPTMVKKGDFLAETVGISPGLFGHVYPDRPGQRNMRNSVRLVHMDANPNVRLVEELFSRVRKWLVSYLPCFFAAWIRPDKVLDPSIYQQLMRGAFTVEGDFDKCDEHLSYDIAIEILDVYDLLLDPMESVALRSYIEQAFQQPVYCGDYLIVGKHNAFSGLPYVSDFETIYDIFLQIGVLLELGLNVEKFFITALGDDMLIMGRMSTQLQTEIRDAITEEANANGHVMQKAKCRLGQGDVLYLRRMKALGMPLFYGENGPYIKGHYPLSLATLSIVLPEHYEPDIHYQWGALFQRLDNVHGSPYWKLYLEFILSRTKKTLRSCAKEAKARDDWWTRLFGESWNPETSPSFQQAIRSGLV
nr:MAG: RNA-dependent RNA-polymerase [Picobirnavirus sp.]